MILHHMLLEMARNKQLTLLKNALDELFCWFPSNQVKANPDKWYLNASCDNELSICVNNYTVTNSKC